MSHKTEAEFWARACEAVDIDTDATGGEWQTAFDKTIADYHARGYEAGRTDAATDISATLDRLATAQERANEQARIANLIAISQAAASGRAILDQLNQEETHHVDS